VIRSERLIIRNGIFIKNGLIESSALSQDCFGAALNQVYRSISLRCHYGVVTVKQSQLFSLRYVAEFDVFGGLGLSRLYCRTSSHDFVHLLAPRVPK